MASLVFSKTVNWIAPARMPRPNRQPRPPSQERQATRSMGLRRSMGRCLLLKSLPNFFTCFGDVYCFHLKKQTWVFIGVDEDCRRSRHANVHLLWNQCTSNIGWWLGSEQVNLQQKQGEGKWLKARPVSIRIDLGVESVEFLRESKKVYTL